MSPREHKLIDDVIVELGDGKALVAESSCDRSGTHVTGYYRLCFSVEGYVVKQRTSHYARKHRPFAWRPPLNDDYTGGGSVWATPVRWRHVPLTCTKVFATAEPRELLRFAKSVIKLVDKSVDRDALICVTLEAGRVVLQSLGATAIACEFARNEKQKPARDGLGQVVVLAQTLKHVLADMGAERCALNIDDKTNDLIVGDRRVWTAAVSAPAPLRKSSYVIIEIGHALLRALSFASIDPDRPNLNNLNVVCTSSGTMIESTDGHRAHREQLTLCLPSTATVKLPVSALLQVLAGRSPPDHLRVFIDSEAERVHLRHGETTYVIEQASAVFPPTGGLFAPGLNSLAHSPRSRYCELLRDEVNVLALWGMRILGKMPRQGKKRDDCMDRVDVEIFPNALRCSYFDSEGEQEAAPHVTRDAVELLPEDRVKGTPLRFNLAYFVSALQQLRPGDDGKVKVFNVSEDANDLAPLMLTTPTQQHLLMPTHR